MRKIARPLMAALVAAAFALGPTGTASALPPPAAAPRPAPPRAVDLRAREITDDGVWAKIGPGGARVKLTLDPKLQRAVERLLARSGAHEGAIVASDVRTGRILAWASRGERDFVDAPFAPSASLFKVVTASALLAGGKANAGTRECYDGGGEHAIEPKDLDVRGTVCMTLGEALGHSINLVVARLAKKYLTPADLVRYAKELGFDGEVPIDVPVGASDVSIPLDPFGMARASAGFWNGHLTPLGALFAMQTIANSGERVRFSLLDHGGPTARVSAGRALDAAEARALSQMLEITTRRGTAAKAFTHANGTRALPGMAVPAKTGTLIGGHPTRMYSWFSGFAPAAKPEVAVTVMLGNDIQWHTKANVVGREVLEAYFGQSEPVHAVASRGGARRK